MRSRPHIVYISFDGLLAPRGYFQIARLLPGLAEAGDYRFTVCSLEGGGDRQNGDRERAVERQLRRRHVRWRRHTRSGSGPIDGARNLRAMQQLVADVIDGDGADMLHARGYLAAAVARRIGDRHQIPYLFDTQGFWVDQQMADSRWLGGTIGEAAARRWEAKLYADCAAAVTLTETAATEIRRQNLGPWSAQRPLSVIPTCVDYGKFGLGGPSSAGSDSNILAELRRVPLVMGVVDSADKADRLEASLRLFDHVLARRPQAHLLCLTDRSPALLTHLQNRGFDSRHLTVRAVTHDEIPRWMGCIDWGLIIDNDSRGRAAEATMPATLGAFFATGVRPVYGGQNGEVRRWIDRAESGHILDRIDEQALREAADRVASTPRCLHTLWGARWRTRPHFGLRRAVQDYKTLYDRLLLRQRPPRMKVLFLTEGTTVPASRFRVEQLLPHLKERGIGCTVRPAYGDGYNRWARRSAGPLYKLACSLQRIPYVFDADKFDVLFLQRPALPFSAAPEKLANWRNPHTIFDVDDAIFCDPQGGSATRQKQAFEEIVKSCAHVICGNDYLASFVRHLTPASVIPTVVDTDLYRPGDDGTSRREIAIGWMGTAANFDSLQLVSPVLKELVQSFPEVVVRIVSNARFEPLDGVEKIEQMRWRADREIEHLQSFDIGIMPLLDNAISRGKCGFKAIQYMAVGIPVVASPVGVNADVLGHGEAGILAEEPSSFSDALARLVIDEELRRTMGTAGLKRVQKYYSVDAVIDRYVDLFEAVARRRPHRRPGAEQFETTQSAGGAISI